LSLTNSNEKADNDDRIKKPKVEKIVENGDSAKGRYLTTPNFIQKRRKDMKRIVALLGLVVFLAVVLAGGTLFAQQLAQKGKFDKEPIPALQKEELVKEPVNCLIAGKYKGVFTDSPSETCLNPLTQDFVIEIDQDGSQIKGEFRNLKTGETFELQGTVKEGKPSSCGGMSPCCVLTGTLVQVTQGVTINFTAPLHQGYVGHSRPCWGTDNGVYNDPHGCGGTFTMRRQ
jgi:hypothetical protein